MKIFNQFLLALCFVFSSLTGSSQTDDAKSWEKKPELSLSGFADIFYVYDFNQPQGTQRQPFLFNHNRHNEFNLNLGLVQLKLNHEKYRANFALQTGTYANDNYAAEPGLLKNIFEANVGISLSSENNLWLDAGVLPSHIGFESAISMDNMTLTRSLLAENSPYFLTGAKLTYNPDEKWELAALVVNGWQRIQRLEGNSLLSFGTQVNYSPTDNLSFNWSTFIGTDDPDATRRMRYFNNLYGQFQVSDKFELIAGFDLGAQQEARGSSAYDFWLSPVLIGQLTLDEQWKTAFRAEYYQDQEGVIIPTNSLNGFKTSGFSLNLDYSPAKSIVCRVESRLLNSQDPIFETDSGSSQINFFVAASIAIKFSELVSN
ncbi:porin [Psychroflexus montanilacus]|uniref:porin n=1 Tax=Psychroflexus montanilacus TaxID=2873598 RepID=UPI001CCD7FC1|nr:porin [Psychroflexus montanilacus]MBZ9651231.1 porin [Psychroflexus montanilacus]